MASLRPGHVREAREHAGRGSRVVEPARDLERLVTERRRTVDVIATKLDESVLGEREDELSASALGSEQHLGFLEQRHGGVPVALPGGEAGGRPEGVGAKRDGGVGRERESEREQPPRLGHVRVSTPEPLQRRDRSERVVGSAGGEEPVDRGDDVVELVLEPLEPDRLLALRVRAEDQAQEVLGMALPQLVERAGLAHSLQRVLAHGLEHRQPEVAVRRLTSDEAPADERLEIAEELRARVGDRSHVVERSAVGERRDRAVQRPLAVGQAPVAPVDRGAKRALALGKIDGPFHLERETFAERAQDLGGWQHRQSRGDELDRERQTVEAAADLVYRGERVVLEQDAARGRELGEQRHGVVDRQWLERVDVLGREPERRAARREHLKVGNAFDQLSDLRGGAREVLEVVEEEQPARACKYVRDGVEHALVTCLARADGTRDGARDELGIGDGREPDEMNRPVERSARSHLEREPALAGTARPRDGHEPCATVEDGLDARESLLPADEPVMERRQTGRAERLQGRELFAQPGCSELEELYGGRDVLQPVMAQGPVRGAGKRLRAGHLPRRL